MSISVRQLAAWVGLFGVMTVGLMLAGLETAGQLFALVQLSGFVGAPLAILLLPQLRSGAVAVVVGVALSMALSGLAAQSLIWFDLASSELVVLAATAYGVVLAWLLDTTQPGVESLAPDNS